MGKIEEIISPQDSLNEAIKLKEAGNEAFKLERYEDALDCYTKAIELEREDTKDKAVYLKNRAAVHLKLDEFEQAAFDCSRALEIVPNDPKALFRRCQAYEGLGKIDAAYADAKQVHNLDPKNKAIEPVLVRLHKAVQAKLTELAQTSNKVKNMFDIVFNMEAESEKREKAADNLIVLAREKAGAELLFKEGVVQKIARLLKV
jgi:protein unc-45